MAKRKIWNGLLSAALCAVLCLFSICIDAQAAEIVESGTYGDNVSWSLDSEGTLTVSGNGTIQKTTSGNSMPWAAYQNQITAVEVAEGITEIPSYTFEYLEAVKTISLPNTLTSLALNAFNDCGSLNDLLIPGSVQTITGSSNTGYPAFIRCESLTDVYYLGTQAQWFSIPKADKVTNSYAEMTMHFLTLHENAPTCTESGTQSYYAFENISVYSGKYDDKGNLITELEVLPALGHDYENGVCTLCGIIGGTCGDNLAWTLEDNGTLTISGTGAMASYTTASDVPWYSRRELINEIIIQDGITSVGAYAFWECSNLTSVTFHGDITDIGVSAFARCSNLKSIILPDSVTSIGVYAFVCCSNLNTITIPRNATSIGGGAFSSCTSLTYITIPDSVTYIGPEAFYGCSSLTSITIPNGVTSIEYGTFYSCNNLTTISIGDGVTSIGGFAFFDCYSLTSITIPDSVISIGRFAFTACSSLRSITIPDSVTTIDECAFRDCNSLTFIAIGDSVSTIGNYAFYNCSSVATVTITDCIIGIGIEAFYGCSSLCHVTYAGNQAQWESINVNDGNTYLTEAEIFHYETILSRAENCINAGIYCPVCKVFLTKEWTEDGTHSYGDWNTTKPATFYADGQKNRICDKCGAEENQIIPQLVARIDQWNMVLSDDLTVNFYMEISEEILGSARILLNIGGEAQTIAVNTLSKAEDGTYLLSANISAAQMNDDIVIVITSGGAITSSATYSVKQYCDEILQNEEHSAYHALVKEMLHYGAMAQIYFGHNADNVSATEGAAAQAVPQSPEQDMVISGELESISFYGASLIYKEKIAVRYYFRYEGDLSQFVFDAGSLPISLGIKDGMVYVEVADILPQDLDQSITLTVTDMDGNQLSVTYGPMNYIVRMYQKNDENLKNLLKALYNYHLAAKELSV